MNTNTITKKERQLKKTDITTILEAVDDFILNKKGYSEGTYGIYTRMAAKLSEFMLTKLNKEDVLLDDLNYEFAEGFVEHLRWTHGISYHTIDTCYLAKISHILSTLSKKGLIRTHFFGAYSIPKYRPVKKNKINDEQVDAIMNASFSLAGMERTRRRIVIMLHTGLTYADSEKFNLSWIHTDDNGKKYLQYYREKTGQEAIVPLRKKIYDFIMEDKKTISERNGKIFKKLSNKVFSESIKRICKKLNIPIFTPHDLRHAFAQKNIDDGVNPYTVAKMLGHATVAMTMRCYARSTVRSVLKDFYRHRMEEK